MYYRLLSTPIRIRKLNAGNTRVMKYKPRSLQPFIQPSLLVHLSQRHDFIRPIRITRLAPFPGDNLLIQTWQIFQSIIAC